jgi:membrane associated rhomboid family serine protease
MTGITFALLVAYSMVNSDRYLSFMMLFPMKAKYFCLLLGAVELYQIVFSPYGKSSWAHLFSMGFAMMYLMYFSAKARGTKIFNFGKGKKGTAKRGKLKLVDPNEVEQEKPKYWN